MKANSYLTGSHEESMRKIPEDKTTEETFPCHHSSHVSAVVSFVCKKVPWWGAEGGGDIESWGYMRGEIPIRKLVETDRAEYFKGFGY